MTETTYVVCYFVDDMEKWEGGFEAPEDAYQWTRDNDIADPEVYALVPVEDPAAE